MISNEEMYEFASQIAGISDSDLQQYKCGGKTKKMQKGKKVDEDANDNAMNLSDLNYVRQHVNKLDQEEAKRKKLEEQRKHQEKLKKPVTPKVKARTVEEVKSWTNRPYKGKNYSY